MNVPWNVRAVYAAAINRVFTSCLSSEFPPTMKRQLNSLESYHLSENASKGTVFHYQLS